MTEFFVTALYSCIEAKLEHLSTSSHHQYEGGTDQVNQAQALHQPP
jgi:hypothetical protein